LAERIGLGRAEISRRFSRPALQAASEVTQTRQPQAPTARPESDVVPQTPPRPAAQGAFGRAPRPGR
jgi:hypothetical protein